VPGLVVKVQLVEMEVIVCLIQSLVPGEAAEAQDYPMVTELKQGQAVTEVEEQAQIQQGQEAQEIHLVQVQVKVITVEQELAMVSQEMAVGVGVLAVPEVLLPVVAPVLAHLGQAVMVHILL